MPEGNLYVPGRGELVQIEITHREMNLPGTADKLAMDMPVPKDAVQYQLHNISMLLWNVLTELVQFRAERWGMAGVGAPQVAADPAAQAGQANGAAPEPTPVNRQQRRHPRG